MQSRDDRCSQNVCEQFERFLQRRPVASGGGERTQMSRRVLVILFGTVLVGAIWAARPIINSQTIPVVSSARAQTATDSPSRVHWSINGASNRQKV